MSVDHRDENIDIAFDSLMKLLLPGMNGKFGVRDIDCDITLHQDEPIELRSVTLSVSGMWIDAAEKSNAPATATTPPAMREEKRL